MASAQTPDSRVAANLLGMTFYGNIVQDFMI